MTTFRMFQIVASAYCVSMVAYKSYDGNFLTGHDYYDTSSVIFKL